MKLGDLKPNPKNPRKITDEKLELLKKTLAEFGDLSGVVYNRKTKRLVGGHQRSKVIPSDSKVTVTKQYEKPTKTGTIAVGYIFVEGDRFAYREVSWDEAKEKAANLAANKGAGDWDANQLTEFFKDLDEYGFDLDLTLFDENERQAFMITEPEFKPGTESDQSKLDEKKRVECPDCGHLFVPGWK